MLYLVDKPLADLAFRTASGDDRARIVLIQDGVVLASETDAEFEDTPVYAVARDVRVRGVDLPPAVEPIGYDTLIELVVEHETNTFA